VEGAPLAIDFEDPAVKRDPFAHYDALNAARAFVATGIGVGIAGYEELVDLGRDHALFSRQLDEKEGRRYVGLSPTPPGPEVEELLARAHPHVPALFTSDPPTHTRHRKLVGQAFVPRRIRAMEPIVRARANELVDAFVDDGAVELRSQLALPLPLSVLADLLGVEPDDRPLLKRWSDDLVRGIAAVLDDEERLAVGRSLLAFQAYFRARIDERLAEQRDDLLSDLVHAELEDGSRLDLAELFPIIAQLVAAGHETTTNFICNSAGILLRDPALLERLRARPEDIPQVLEECLRWDPPLHSTVRRAKADAVVHGCPVARNQTVIPVWAAGNRDAAEFPDPHRFDPDRPNAHRHLSFGYGLHFCLGSELGRLQGRVAWETLLERLDDLRLDEARSELVDRGGFAHYGWPRLVVTFRQR
jgi:cytochrome P450